MPQLTLALEAIARHRPDAIAVTAPGIRLTFAELCALARRAAAALHRAGLAPGEMVGFSVREELTRLVLQLGLMRLGCPSVTLASFEPLEVRTALAARCSVVTVLSDTDIAHPDGLPVLRMDFDAIRHDLALEAEGRALPQPDGATTAVVLTSSGTTGLPKLVRRNQAQLLAYYQTEWPLRPRSVANFGPPESNAWTWTTLSNLGRGSAIAFLDPGLPFPEACRQAGVTKSFVWPARLPDLIAECRSTRGGSPLRDICLLTGGAGVEHALQQEVLAEVTRYLVIVYGATEAGGIASMPADPKHTPPGAVGYTSPGFEVAIFDDQGRRLPAGETGFLRVRSLWTATEYWQDPEATARAFIDGWWQPGDLGRRTEDGLLVFAGRGDDMMVMNSINIFPAEIERVAATFPGVQECAAFPVDTPRYGQLPLLAVVAVPGLSPDALMDYCRQRLGVRAPRKVVLVDALPRNTAGKVLRKELAERYGRAR